jgi:hypothetical protein
VLLWSLSLLVLLLVNVHDRIKNDSERKRTIESLA